MTFTYNTLVSATMAASEDDSSEFLAYIPTAIDLAEQRMCREMDSYGLTSVVSAAMTSADPYVTKPSGTFIIKSLGFRKSDGSQLDLLLRTDEFLRDYWPISTSVGVPKYYGWYGQGGTRLRIAPTPNSSYNVEWTTVVRPTPLTSATQTNWFTENASDALFYASMCEMMKFAKNPTAIQIWDANYQTAVGAIQNEARRTRRDDQTPNTSPAGGDDTLTGGN